MTNRCKTREVYSSCSPYGLPGLLHMAVHSFDTLYSAGRAYRASGEIRALSSKKNRTRGRRNVLPMTRSAVELQSWELTSCQQAEQLHYRIWFMRPKDGSLTAVVGQIARVHHKYRPSLCIAQNRGYRAVVSDRK
jgi:hypothetical protein